jgi:hypothetical protein
MAKGQMEGAHVLDGTGEITIADDSVPVRTGTVCQVRAGDGEERMLDRFDRRPGAADARLFPPRSTPQARFEKIWAALRGEHVLR